ncbi:MAG: sulfite exporter TauE/SafE family protein [Gammaproteobacteria bacterium]|jgi:sulfite exporter TauE/SafE|nr:sulfite exporter TauE/SafE family protein [Gammaproteobacteria bacterium]
MISGTLLTAWLVGLLGGVHCIGMCGGVVATLTAGLPREERAQIARQLPFQLAYNIGRIGSYTLAGALMGALGAVALELLPLHLAQRILYGVAAAFMLALGLYLGGWWQGLTRVERLGALLWQRIEPLGRRFIPVRRWWQALAVGLVWGWLPCGLVYSVLIWSAGSGSALQGALLMLLFGLGTLPNLLGIGLLAGAAARLIEQRWLRQAAGALVIGFALYAFWQLLAF